MSKVHVAVCSKQNPTWRMMLQYLRASELAQTKGVQVGLRPHVGSSMIARTRDIALAVFLQDDSTHILFLDDDVIINEDGILKLLEADKDIISGVYRKKNNAPDGQAMTVAFDQKTEIHTDPVICAYAPAGYLLIKREVIEKMFEDYKDLSYTREGLECTGLFIPQIHENQYLAEDFSFCKRAKDSGYEIWTHPQCQAGHEGTKIYALGENNGVQ